MKKASNYPKIGIRPIIDGRLGGVRESLEETTMKMAQNVKALYEAQLKYPDGSAVECIVADSCIGGVREAADCAQKFESNNVGVSLSVTPCWCYGSETMDMNPLIPKAIWGFNGTERPGAVYLAATLAAHTQFGLPAFGIYGRDVQDLGDAVIPADVSERLLNFARSGLAVAIMRGKSYLAIGSVSMGIAGSIVNPYFFRIIWECVMSILILLRFIEESRKKYMMKQNTSVRWHGSKKIALREKISILSISNFQEIRKIRIGSL